jgi:diguanylate cyclase (GGDEF)-like protein
MNLQAPALAQRFVDMALSTDALLRLRIKRSLLAVPVYLVSILLPQHVVSQGLVEATPARWLSIYTLSGPIIVYAAMRSGATRRLRDPALQIPHMLFGISAVLVDYVVNPPARSADLLLLTLVMIFGVFELEPRQAWGLCAVVLGLLAALAIGLPLVDPLRFERRVELLNFGVAAVVMPTLAALTARTHRLRGSLRLQRAELEHALRSVEKLAMHDSLTGLVNRRRVQQRLDEEITRQARSGSGLCVVMIDIDNFKQVNDRHGHAGGDWVLQRFAAIAISAVRATDVLARWGGEEFLLVLPDTRSADARVLFERVVSRLRDPANWLEHPERQISVSAGLAEYRSADRAATLLERADARLYAAKARGRDRIAWA